jgi:hypothetical protein
MASRPAGCLLTLKSDHKPEPQDQVFTRNRQSRLMASSPSVRDRPARAISGKRVRRRRRLAEAVLENALSCRESSGLVCVRGSARRRHRPESSGQVRRTGGYPRDEPADRSRGPEDVDLGVTGMGGDRLQVQRTAALAIGKQPPPEVSALPRPADGPPCATGRGEVLEHDGVRGLQPDTGERHKARGPRP